MAASEKGCCVPRCGKTRKYDTVLHSFPNPDKDMDRYLTWIQAVGINLSSLDPQYVYRNRRVCHVHFESNFLTWTRRLSPGAVPTLLLPGSKSTTSNQTGQDTTEHHKETLATTTEDKSQTETIADAQSRLSNIRKRPDGLPVSASGSDKIATPRELRLSSTAQTCKTLTNNKSSPDSTHPTATDEHAPPISIVDEAGKESNIDDDAELLTLSDLEVEYLDILSEEEVESTGVEETLTEAGTALVDEASEAERTTNVTGDANLLIYDTENLPIKNIICATCFSSGRTLYPLVQRMYFSMVQQFCSHVQFTEEDMICWECDAMINKMRKFQDQVLKAQSQFQQFTQGDKVIITKSLSCMKTTEITHISISSDSTSEVVELEDELVNLENDRDSVYTEAMQTSPIHQPTDRSGVRDKKVLNGTISSSLLNKDSEIPNEIKVFEIYYDEPKQNYNVLLKESANLLPQPNSLKEVCKEKVMTEDEMEQFRRDMRSKWKRGEHSCHKCIITFKSAKQLNEHNKIHDPKAGNYTCRVCEQRFSDVGLRDAHYQSHFVVFECASCGLLAGGRDAMLGHFERLHREQRRVCRDCGEVFMLFQEFRQHRLVAHGPKMTCEHCGKIFRVRRNITRHLNLHKKQELFENKCQVCGTRFRLPRVLQKHLLKVHDIKEKENYCALCKKSFKNWNSYRIHLSTLKHMKLSNEPIENIMRQCEDCGRFFTNVVQLRVHRKTYHLYEKCVCDLCNKEFISKALLIQHLKCSNRHKTDRVRNRMCEHCGKSFYDIAALKVHLYTHNTERRFACELCGSAFTNPLSRYRHRRRVHNLGKVHWKNFSSSFLFPIGRET